MRARNAARGTGYAFRAAMFAPAAFRFCLLGAALLAAPVLSARDSVKAGVAVLHSAEWNAGDTVRDGAGEFAVFLRAAQLQRQHTAAGLVAVGDRNGILRSGGERALRRLVFSGVAIVKLAAGSEPMAGDLEVFLNGGRLPADQAASVLAQCLERHGPPPGVADPENPTAAEVAKIRSHLRPFQAALALAGADRVARL